MTAARVNGRAADPTVLLVDDEVHMARSAVRNQLRDIASKYRRELRHGAAHYAQSRLDQFDRYLDLFERLGGDPDTVPDIEDHSDVAQNTAAVR